MYLKEEMYEKSRQDFSSAISISKNKGFAYLGKGTCEIKMHIIEEAIKTFTEGIETDLGHVCY
jgi:tetratricopeptide (TPR) repeat protein